MKSAAKKSSRGRPAFGVLLLTSALSFAACEKNEELRKIDANAAFMGVMEAYSHSLDVSQEDGVAKAFGEEIADRAWKFEQENGGARPVYGEDDRRHYWEIKGAEERSWADATCLVTVNAPARRASGNAFGLVELPGGEYRLKTALIKGSRIPDKEGIKGGIEPDLTGSVPMCGNTDADRSTAGFGTAWLAKADVVVTAGHVVAKARGIKNLAFVFGYKVLADGQAPETVVKREQVYHAVSLLGYEYYGKGDHRDFAVIRLDRAVPESLAKPLVVSNLNSIPDETRIGLIGYPNGLPQRSAFGDLTRAFGLEQSQRLCYVTNLDSFAGNSGSPVIDPDRGEVIGILIRGKEIEYAVEPGGRCFDKISLPETYKPSELVLKASFFRRHLTGSANHR